MNLVLRPLTINDREAFFEGLSLFSDMDRDWYTFVWNEDMSYENHLKILDDECHGKNLKEGRVPSSMLYAFLDGKIVGRSSIRHELNEFLSTIGGHIGYAVATSYRKQGIATEILKQSLLYCKNELGLKKVLLTCDDDNVASYRTIEKNGGLLEDRYIATDGTVVKRRYWIKL